jgi:CheY-like chemotaxis protein
MAPQVVIAGPEGEAQGQLAAILRAGGYDVRLCMSEQLLEEIAPPGPDLLIVLEDAAAIPQLIRRLKGSGPARDIPVVAALLSPDEAGAAWALEAGADEFLLAPFEPREVLTRLAVMLRLLQDRRLLLRSQEEFSRIFAETHQPLFLCNRAGGGLCRLNRSLRRFLGFPGKREEVPVPLEELLFGPEDRERFRQIVSQPGGMSHVKLHLKSREGAPVTVLLSDLALPDNAGETVSFQVQPVGPASPLKKALRGLVDHLFPSAREYLTLLQLTPLLGGRYDKINKLGQGSFGEVWLVVDTESLSEARQYVAKIPFLKAANVKFRKEAAILQKLAGHPGVAHLKETLEDDGRLVLIQEYVQGKTLADMLGEELPRPLVERIILQLIDVTAYAHKQRIMHRDIKPANIIITPGGILKLLDFGVAKILGDKDISATMVGSRPFMAPEQIMGKSERRSDIWAIGVLMYLLYTGELPFYCEVEKLLIDLILEQEPVPPREHRAAIPKALENIILRCLKKKVEERYPSAVALRADLLRHYPHYGTQGGRWPWIH